MKCELCNCELIEKCKEYGKPGFGNCISIHHCFPKRLLKFFNEEEIKEQFGLNNKNTKVVLCYDCHEEMIHNIVFNPKIIKKLNKKMSEKTIKERIIILHKQLLK